jgi:hypothetical protein
MKTYPFRILIVRKNDGYSFRRVYSNGKDYPEYGIKYNDGYYSTYPRSRYGKENIIDGFDISHEEHRPNNFSNLDRYLPSLHEFNEKIKCTLLDS